MNVIKVKTYEVVLVDWWSKESLEKVNIFWWNVAIRKWYLVKTEWKNILFITQISFCIWLQFKDKKYSQVLSNITFLICSSQAKCYNDFLKILYPFLVQGGCLSDITSSYFSVHVKLQTMLHHGSVGVSSE